MKPDSGQFNWLFGFAAARLENILAIYRHLLMERYRNIKDLSAAIGLSVRTIRNWVVDPVNPIPCFRVGGKLLFEESEVVKWIEQFRVEVVDVSKLADELINVMKKEKNYD